MSVIQLARICTQLHLLYQQTKNSRSEPSEKFKKYRLIYTDCWKITNKLDSFTNLTKEEHQLRRLILQRLEELTSKCLKHKLQ
jgi:hypothetical protein